VKKKTKESRNVSFVDCSCKF